MDLSNVLIKPLLTEKTYMQSMADKKKYYFQVHAKATKTLVRQAFQAIYGIAPLKINMLVRKSVRTKTGTARPGYTKAKKIAVVTLPAGIEVMITGAQQDSTSSDKKSTKE